MTQKNLHIHFLLYILAVAYYSFNLNHECLCLCFRYIFLKKSHSNYWELLVMKGMKSTKGWKVLCDSLKSKYCLEICKPIQNFKKLKFQIHQRISFCVSKNNNWTEEHVLFSGWIQSVSDSEAGRMETMAELIWWWRDDSWYRQTFVADWSKVTMWSSNLSSCKHCLLIYAAPSLPSSVKLVLLELFIRLHLISAVSVHVQKLCQSAVVDDGRTFHHNENFILLWELES